MPKRPRDGRPANDEWIGGSYLLPAYVRTSDPEQAYRPAVFVWVQPERGVVGMETAEPGDAGAVLGKLLRSAAEKPMVGPPGLPARVRVSSPELAGVLAHDLRGEVSVAVAPTPELDDLFAGLVEHLGRAQDGAPATSGAYLSGGELDPPLVGALFRAAELLFRVAPWRALWDSTPIRIDIPGLGVEGACLVIIGAAGESRGFLLFPSALALADFRRTAEMAPANTVTHDLGTDWLSVSFEPLAEQTPEARKEAARHLWPLAGPAAYPVVDDRDRNAIPRPLSERSLRIATACADAFTQFFRRHGARIQKHPGAVGSDFFTTGERVSVRVTLPYEEGEKGNVTPDPTAGATALPGTRPVGRSDPCPCGSGKQYKKCHFSEDVANRVAPSRPQRHPAHAMDERVVRAIRTWAVDRFGPALDNDAAVFADAASSTQLWGPWSLYGQLVDGKTPAEWYLAERGSVLTRAERDWFLAQRAAWLSVWEVMDVEPGQGVTVEDLLSGERRRVDEVLGSRQLVRRDALLGRVVDYAGRSVFCGMHPRILSPEATAVVIERARKRLRLKREVPIARLRPGAFAHFLIRCWEETVAAWDRRPPPRLQNTDGDDLLLTVDHFVFEPGYESEMAAVLATLEPCHPPEPGQTPPAFEFFVLGNAMHREWENTLVGRAVFVGPGKLDVETNSVRRADDLRRRIERAGAPGLRHRGRSHTDPSSPPVQSEHAARQRTHPPETPPPEVLAALRELQARHLATWLDQPIPALLGETPREAARSRQGRARLDVVLKSIENQEARFSPEAAADVVHIRRELGMD